MFIAIATYPYQHLNLHDTDTRTQLIQNNYVDHSYQPHYDQKMIDIIDADYDQHYAKQTSVKDALDYHIMQLTESENKYFKSVHKL